MSTPAWEPYETHADALVWHSVTRTRPGSQLRRLVGMLRREEAAYWADGTFAPLALAKSEARFALSCVLAYADGMTSAGPE